jgi:hypothetical protein
MNAKAYHAEGCACSATIDTFGGGCEMEWPSMTGND